ncbi:MAG: hypothetical protein IT559_04695 [Alphaproteobacteria bacterium]|nr:hypothetical protein [Alphaproteobacteria bacterium]
MTSSFDQNSDNKLTGAQFRDFCTALELFYIEGNLSGRLKFAAAWPDGAVYLLGAELMEYDREGVQDRERRSALEAAAEIRRLELLNLLSDLEKSSVASGILQVDFVEELIKKLGRACSLYVYSEKIVNRFAPPVGGSDEDLSIAHADVLAKPSQPEISRMAEPVSVPPVSETPVSEPPPPAKLPATPGSVSIRFVPAPKKTDNNGAE